MMDYERATSAKFPSWFHLALPAHFSRQQPHRLTSVTAEADGSCNVLPQLGRTVTFPRFGGTNVSPSWSPDGSRIAFSSSQAATQKSTSPQWRPHLKARTTPLAPTSRLRNPKTGSQIAFVSAAAACRRSSPWKPTAPTPSA